MASVVKSDIPEVAAFMSEYWALMKNYWIAEDTDEYWDAVMKDAGELGRKYDFQFAKESLLVFLNQLEREWKRLYGEKYGCAA